MSNQKISQISCPNCGESIDVNNALHHQLEDKLKRQFDEKITLERVALSEREANLKDEQNKILREKAAFDTRLSEALDEAIKKERNQLERQISDKITKDIETQLQSLQTELEKKSNQVKELHQSKADLEKIKREKEELRSKLEVEAQQKISEVVAKEKERIQITEAEKARFRILEQDEVINQLRQQLSSAQRKAEQGSSQLQGEVQEIAIEKWLSNEFPLDSILEIKKGERGADCVQVVNTRSRSNCGQIYYESKRAKKFQPAWLEKFKNDIRQRNADIGVLVTESMPTDMERMGLKEGIWVCTFDEFKGLAIALRESLIRASNAVAVKENKGDKMGMLYDYLTSNEFRLQIEAIVEGFSQMKADLDSEKRAMASIWKKREKQIEKVLLNTGQMYGSVKGIAGNAVQSVPQLELPTEGEEF